MVHWEAMNLPLEHHPAHDVLHRMYTKKMRRPKKIVEGQEEDSEEELDDNADDDEDEYEDEEVQYSLFLLIFYMNTIFKVLFS
jgi:hypothetical protein